MHSQSSILTHVRSHKSQGWTRMWLSSLSTRQRSAGHTSTRNTSSISANTSAIAVLGLLMDHCLCRDSIRMKAAQSHTSAVFLISSKGIPNPTIPYQSCEVHIVPPELLPKKYFLLLFLVHVPVCKSCRAQRVP